jgi:hypothetical protein
MPRMIAELADQLIGSIRRVRMVPVRIEGAAAGDAIASDHAADAIEIETKSGRYAHLIAGSAPDSLRWVPGPVRAPQDAPSRRVWADLTAAVPAAFDGRPRIVAITPVDLGQDGSGYPTARAWRIELTTGIHLLCARPAGEMEVRAVPA